MPSQPAKPRLRSPRVMASADMMNRPMARVVIGPMVTNSLEYTVGLIIVQTPTGPLTLTNQTFVKVERCNNLKQVPQVWTNCWFGPLPANRKLIFNSIAPANVPAFYRFTLSFQAF